MSILNILKKIFWKKGGFIQKIEKISTLLYYYLVIYFKIIFVK